MLMCKVIVIKFEVLYTKLNSWKWKKYKIQEFKKIGTFKKRRNFCKNLDRPQLQISGRSVKPKTLKTI